MPEKKKNMSTWKKKIENKPKVKVLKNVVVAELNIVNYGKRLYTNKQRLFCLLMGYKTNKSGEIQITIVDTLAKEERKIETVKWSQDSDSKRNDMGMLLIGLQLKTIQYINKLGAIPS